MTSYQQLFEQHEKTISQHSAAALNVQRRMFYERWCMTGWPTKHTENYRHIDFGQLTDIDYGLNLSQLDMGVKPQHMFHCNVPDIGNQLFFVVGEQFVAPANTGAALLPEGVVVCSMKDASTRFPELVGQYVNTLAAKVDDPLVNFNGAFAQDGFFVYVAEGVCMEQPIQLVNIMSGSMDMMANAHNLVVVGNGATARLLVCDHVLNSTPHFCATRTTEVILGKHATYEHYKLESTSHNTCSLNNLFVSQQAESTLLTNVITLHNGMTRNNIIITQDGERCDTTLCGMAIADGEQTADNFSRIIHHHVGGHSRELFKYILDENSRGNFCGQLMVMPGAQQTEAYQTNRNLLLANTAQVKTKPQLEIYADDVKCSHGATTGQLDEAALFYMRQRGIGYQEARMLLMQAFVSDVIDHIKIDPLRTRISEMVENRLRNRGRHDAHRCNTKGCEGCSLSIL